MTKFSGHHPMVKTRKGVQVRKTATCIVVCAAGGLTSPTFCCERVAPLANDNKRIDEYDNGNIAVRGW